MVGFEGVTSGIIVYRMARETLKERVSRLEEMVEDWSNDDAIVFVCYIRME